MHVYIYLYVCICLHISMFVYVRRHTCTCSYVSVHACNVYLCIYICLPPVCIYLKRLCMYFVSSKDRLDLTSKSRQAAVSTQPQSTMFDLEDLFSDPHLDFGNIADDSSFCDIPDLLPNSTQWTSLSDLSLDKGLSSCPASPMGSIPTLSPATSASRSPRMGSSAVPQGRIPKEGRPPKQGRGRPRSSKKATVFERAQSWMPPCSSTMGGGTMGGGMTMGQGTFSVPVVTTQQESKRNLVHPRSVGSYSAVGG